MLPLILIALEKESSLHPPSKLLLTENLTFHKQMQITTIEVINKAGIPFYAFFGTSSGLTFICKVNKGDLMLARVVGREICRSFNFK